jgi:integrase
MAKQPKKKPKAFPLTLHRATGQWCKKLKVLTTNKWRVCYFGQDRQKALERYLAEKDAIQAGQVRRGEESAPNASATVATICNEFLDAKRRKIESGEMGERQWKDYHGTAVRLRDFFTRERLVATITPREFGLLRASLAKTRGPVALGNEIQRVRTMLRFADKTKLIPAPVDYGDEFQKPSAKKILEARNAAGSRMMEPADLRSIIAECGPQLRGMVYLALNCGFGQSDCAALPRFSLDLSNGWVDFPRVKTAVPRRIPLWPETIEALRAAIEARPKPKDVADDDAVFITAPGARWVRMMPNPDPRKPASAVDSVATEYTKILRKLGLKRAGSFYGLRHIHRTISDEANDQRASDYIMGHVDPSMAAKYRERPPSDERLRAVVNAVREWLFPTHGPQPLAAGEK